MNNQVQHFAPMPWDKKKHKHAQRFVMSNLKTMHILGWMFFLHVHALHSRGRHFRICRIFAQIRRLHSPNTFPHFICRTARHPFESAEYIPFQKKSKCQCGQADCNHSPWIRHCLLGNTFLAQFSLLFRWSFWSNFHIDHNSPSLFYSNQCNLLV